MNMLVVQVKTRAGTRVLSVPVTRVQQIIGYDENATTAYSSWPGLDVAPEAPRWLLALQNASSDAVRPVWEIEFLHDVNSQSLHPVPEILKGWARRLRVTGFLQTGTRLVPIVEG